MSEPWRGRPHADLSVELQLPEDARDIAHLSPVDLSVAPGAKLLLHKGWVGGRLRVEVLCAEAPAKRWIEGLEATVLSGATAVVRRAAGLQRMRPGELRTESASGLHWEQLFDGDGPDGTTAHGLHVFGFVGAQPRAALCTFACLEPAPAEGCVVLMRSASLQAAFVPPPAPGWWAGCLGAVAAQPQFGAIGLLLFLVAAVALLLRFRPRPRW